MVQLRNYFTFLLCILYSVAFSQNDIPERPSPERLVNDFENILSSQEEQQLESKLRSYNDTTSTQIAVVTVPDFGQYELADYSQRLAQKWGIGQKGKNNGILILVSKSMRQARIEVGYGMEGLVPDATAHRIIEEYMIPNFKQGQYFQGIDQASDIIIKLASGQFKADKKPATGGGKVFIIILVILIIIIIISRNSRGGGGYTNYSSGGTFFGGGGWSGGSGGGGIDFGGGSFGGGGASGRW